MPIRETETFFNLLVTPADGSPPTEHLYKSLTEAQRIEEAAEKVKAKVEVTRGQAFTVTTAESLADIPNVVKDEQTAVGLFNYGAKMYQINNRGRHMKTKTWKPVDGPWDLIQEIQYIKATRKARKRTKDELAPQRREFKKMYKVRHPESPMPSDAVINKLLDEMLQKQMAGDIQEFDTVYRVKPFEDQASDE